LLVANSEWLPRSFVLIDNFAGTKRDVRVAWTGPDQAGVRYVDETTPTARKPSGFGRRM
jgi:hypothetical protein